MIRDATPLTETGGRVRCSSLARDRVGGCYHLAARRLNGNTRRQSATPSVAVVDDDFALIVSGAGDDEPHRSGRSVGRCSHAIAEPVTDRRTRARQFANENRRRRGEDARPERFGNPSGIRHSLVRKGHSDFGERFPKGNNVRGQIHQPLRALL